MSRLKVVALIVTLGLPAAAHADCHDSARNSKALARCKATVKALQNLGRDGNPFQYWSATGFDIQFDGGKTFTHYSGLLDPKFVVAVAAQVCPGMKYEVHLLDDLDGQYIPPEGALNEGEVVWWTG